MVIFCSTYALIYGIRPTATHRPLSSSLRPLPKYNLRFALFSFHTASHDDARDTRALLLSVVGTASHMQIHKQSHTAIMHQSPSVTVCVQQIPVYKTQKQSSGPTEVLKTIARNAALVVPDGMAPAMPASATALAWGLESL